MRRTVPVVARSDPQEHVRAQVVKATPREVAYAQRVLRAMKSLEDFDEEGWARIYEEEGEAAAYAAIPTEAFEQAMYEASDRYLTAALTKEGGEEAARLGLSFDTANYRVFEYINDRTADLVVQVTRDQRTAIQNIIADAAMHGGNPRVIAAQIKNVVGLHDRWSTAVQSYDRRLVEEGLSYSERQRLVGGYHDKLLRARALNIARTETMRAQNQGRWQSWAQAIDNGVVKPGASKEWITSAARVCPICAPMNGVVVGWNEMFSTGLGDVMMPPLHPSCRCTAVLIPTRARSRDDERSLMPSQRQLAGAAALFIASPADDILIASAFAAINRVGLPAITSWLYTKLPWGRTMPLAEVYQFPVQPDARTGFTRIIYREIATETEQDRFIRKTFGRGVRNRRRYSNREREIVEAFRGGADRFINGVLRRGSYAEGDRLYTRAEIGDTIGELDDFMSKGEVLESPVKLFRPMIVDEDAFRLGDVFVEEGFPSGYLLRADAERALERLRDGVRRAYLVEIDVPAGERVQWLGVGDDLAEELVEEGVQGEMLMLPRGLDMRVARIHDEDGVRRVLLNLHDPADLELPLNGPILRGETLPFPESMSDVFDGFDSFMVRISHPDWYHSKGFTVEEILSEDVVGLRRGQPVMWGVARFSDEGSTIGITRQTAERVSLLFDTARNNPTLLSEHPEFLSELVRAVKVMLHEGLHLTGPARVRITAQGARALEEASVEMLARELVPEWLRFMGIPDVDMLPWDQVSYTSGYRLFIDGLDALANRVSALDPLTTIWRWTRTETDYPRRLVKIGDDLLASIGIQVGDLPVEARRDVAGLIDRYFKRMEGFGAEVIGWDDARRVAWHERRIDGLMSEIEEVVTRHRPPPGRPPGGSGVLARLEPPIIEEIPIRGVVVPLRPVADIDELPTNVPPEPPVPPAAAIEFEETGPERAWNTIRAQAFRLAEAFGIEQDDVARAAALPDGLDYLLRFDDGLAAEGYAVIGGKWSGATLENKLIQQVLNGQKISSKDALEVTISAVGQEAIDEATQLTREYIDAMDAAFADDAAEMITDLTVWRGTWLSKGELQQIMGAGLQDVDALKGLVRTEKGFLATTASRGMAEWFQDVVQNLHKAPAEFGVYNVPVLFKVKLKTGDRAIWVNNDVAEVLLGRETPLRVTKASYVDVSPTAKYTSDFYDRQLVLEMEVVESADISLPSDLPRDSNDIPIIPEDAVFDWQLTEWYRRNYPEGLPERWEPTTEEITEIVRAIRNRARKLSVPSESSPGMRAVLNEGRTGTVALDPVEGDIAKALLRPLNDFARRYPRAAASIQHFGLGPTTSSSATMTTQRVGGGSLVNMLEADVTDVTKLVRDWYPIWARDRRRFPANFDIEYVNEYFVAHELGHVLYNYAEVLKPRSAAQRQNVLMPFLKNYMAQFAREGEDVIRDFATILNRELSNYPATQANPWTEIIAESYAEVALDQMGKGTARPFAKGVVRWVEGLIESEEAREAAPSLARKLQEGGFTVRTVSGEEPPGGYMVSLPRAAGHEIPLDLTGMDGEEVALRVLEYQLARADVLRVEDHYFGGWREGDTAFLDVSKNYASKEAAIRAALANEQNAMFDYSRFEAITTRKHTDDKGVVHFVEDGDVARIRRELGLPPDTATPEQLQLFEPDPLEPLTPVNFARSEMEEKLSRGTVVVQKRPSDATYNLVYEGEIDGTDVIIKPTDPYDYDEIRLGIMHNTQNIRERAAYIIDQYLGGRNVRDQGFVGVPPTVLRDAELAHPDAGLISFDEVMVQEFKDADATFSHFITFVGGGWMPQRELLTTYEIMQAGALDVEDLRKLALFDAILANSDRHADNLLIRLTTNAETGITKYTLIPIDHGISMSGQDEGQRIRSVASQALLQLQGDESALYTGVHDLDFIHPTEGGYPEGGLSRLSSVLRSLLGHRERIDADLSAIGIEADEIEGMWDRVNEMLESGQILPDVWGR